MENEIMEDEVMEIVKLHDGRIVVDGLMLYPCCAKSLKVGDEVFWSDPDNNLCSRYANIEDIDIENEIAVIDNDTEVYISELYS